MEHDHEDARRAPANERAPTARRRWAQAITTPSRSETRDADPLMTRHDSRATERKRNEGGRTSRRLHERRPTPHEPGQQPIPHRVAGPKEIMRSSQAARRTSRKQGHQTGEGTSDVSGIPASTHQTTTTTATCPTTGHAHPQDDDLDAPTSTVKGTTQQWHNAHTGHNKLDDTALPCSLHRPKTRRPMAIPTTNTINEQGAAADDTRNRWVAQRRKLLKQDATGSGAFLVPVVSHECGRRCEREEREYLSEGAELDEAVAQMTQHFFATKDTTSDDGHVGALDKGRTASVAASSGEGGTGSLLVPTPSSER